MDVFGGVLVFRLIAVDGYCNSLYYQYITLPRPEHKEVPRSLQIKHAGSTLKQLMMK